MQAERSLEESLEKTGQGQDGPTDLEKIWFETPPPSGVRRTTAPPPPVEKVGEFLGDPDVDGWLR